jgi:FkbM family methyltransferase
MAVELHQVEGVNDHETAFLYDEIFVRQSYLPDGLALPDDAVVIDVGANIGMFTLWVHSIRPTASIMAFEPLEPLAAKLQRNVDAHGVRATVFHCGLSDTDHEETPFTYYPGYSTMSTQSRYADTAAEKQFVRQRVLGGGEAGDLVEHLDEVLDYRFRPDTRVCRLRRLSTVLDEHPVSRIDMLKIDVQRAEADVLRGIEPRHWPLIRHVVMEVHDAADTGTDGQLGTIVRDLVNHGFQVTTEQENALVGTDRYVVYARRNHVTSS